MKLKQIAARNPDDIGSILLDLSAEGCRIFTLRDLGPPEEGTGSEDGVYHMVTGYKTRADLAEVPSEVLI